MQFHSSVKASARTCLRQNIPLQFCPRQNSVSSFGARSGTSVQIFGATATLFTCVNFQGADRNAEDVTDQRDWQRYFVANWSASTRRSCMLMGRQRASGNSSSSICNILVLRSISMIRNDVSFAISGECLLNRTINRGKSGNITVFRSVWSFWLSHC